MLEQKLSKTLLENTIKKTYEESLEHNGTGLIIYACGTDMDQPKMAWGRATANAYGYGMANYNDLKKVRDADGDVSAIRERKAKYKNGYDDSHIDLIEEYAGNIWVHSFITTKTIQQAIELKETMYRLGIFESTPMRFIDASRPECNLLASAKDEFIAGGSQKEYLEKIGA